MVMTYQLQMNTKVGHRRVSTIGPLPQARPFETMVFGGRNRDKIAYEIHYDAQTAAEAGHSEIVEDVRSNPGKYRLGNLF